MSPAFRLVPRAGRRARRALGVVRERLSRIAVSAPRTLLRASLVTLVALAPTRAALADPIQVAGIRVAVVPSSPCAGDSVAVQFSTCACGTRFTSAGFDASGRMTLVVANDPSIVCVRCDSLAATATIGQFAAGSYVLGVDVVVNYGHAGGVDSTRTFHGELSYQVRGDCGPGPTPGVRYLQSVRIGGAACDSCPGVACPGDSVLVLLGGEFPDASFTLDHLEVVPSMLASPRPAPGIVRVFYRTCGVGAQIPVPWNAAICLAPLPPGDYGLGVEGFLYAGCGPVVAQPVGALSAPFAVLDSCGAPPARCYQAGFVHLPGGACDAAVGPNLPADVTLAVGTTVALAGLQGRFAFDTPGLRVTDLAAVGPAAGMLLSWQPTADGASFVLVATSGAPILPIAPSAGVMSTRSPVLRVRVSAVDGVPVPDHARLMPLDLVAADANGVAVPSCALRNPSLVIDPAAHLCRASACDFNGDGVTDVRDLVVMVHCVLDSTSCPPGAADHVDCNGDGVKDVSDVLCCARLLLAGLRGGGAGGRPDADVRVALGAPQATATGADVPVTLTGLAGVGAARVDFAYPDARYDVTSVEPAGGAATGWLTLEQASGGKLAFGLVALGANAGATLPVVVHLALKPGQTAGGEFGLDGGEFAGQDGAALVTQVTAMSTPLAGGTALALSAPRPNPFAASTRFALTLARAQAVDVGVFDLAGRRVATLFHGAAPVGVTPLVWDRTRDRGARVGAGVYFIRATSARGEVAGSKILVLSRE